MPLHQPGEIAMYAWYCVARSSPCFECLEQVLAVEYPGEVLDLSRCEWRHSLAIPCGDGLDEVEGALVEAH